MRGVSLIQRNLSNFAFVSQSSIDGRLQLIAYIHQVPVVFIWDEIPKANLSFFHLVFQRDEWAEATSD